MKAGKTLQELAEEITRQANNKRDFKVPAKQLQVESNGHTQMVIGENKFQLEPTAHDQIATKLAIPKVYYDKMRATAPQLLDANINHWLQSDFRNDKGEIEKDKTFIVRTLDGSARALVSDRFNLGYDNHPFAEAVLPVLMEMNLIVMSCQITAKRVFIKAVSRDIEKDIPTGAKMGNGHIIFDTLVPAITCSNSEIGFGSMSILGSVFTRQCTNLATFGERSVRKYHVGSKHESTELAYELFSDETKNKTNEATWAQIRDVVKAAFDRAKFDMLCEKIAATSEQKIGGDVPKVIELTSKQFGLTGAEQNSVLRHLIEGGDLTRYGLYSAITRTAEDLEDYDRASEFEKFGGKLIELPQKDWKVLAQAA